MKRPSLNNQGFVHHMASLMSVVVVLIGAILFVVVRANQSANKSVNLATGQSSQSKLTTKTASNTANAQTANTATNESQNTSTQSSTASTSSKPKTTTSTSGSTSPTNPTPTQTPLSALTAIVSSLQSGGSAQVTASAVDVPGPISTAHARPIVFTVNGKTYFAYTQESPPDFSTTASQTAGSMAIVTGNTSGAAFSQAHLDKAGNLVDENSQAVGFSTGGN